MMIFPSRRPVTIRLLSKETAMDHISSPSSMAVPILARVDVSRNETEFDAIAAMNLLLPAREIERSSVRIGDSASWDPVDTLKDMIFLFDTVKS